MSSIIKRPNGRWRARYRDEAGKEHARHFDRKVDGQRWLDEVTASVVTGQYVDPRAGKVLVREYAAQWEAAQVGRDATARIVDNALRLHILPALGDRPMATVPRSDVQAFVKRLTRTLAAGSVGNVYATLARLFAAAVDDRIITTTPCVRIALPEPSGGEVVPPTAEHVDQLARAVPARYRAVVILLAGAGLRIGEALGLRIADVDFLRRELRVERQRLQDGSLGPTKTPESVRTVPLAQVVVDELAAHVARYRCGEWLFTTGTGESLVYASWQTVWNSAQRPDRKAIRAERCPRCGAGPETRCQTARGTSAAASHDAREATARGGEATDTHDLRHFYASALIAGGASVKQVSRLLGHASAVITLKVYAHLWPGDDERARSVVDAALDVVRTGRGLADLAESV